MPLVQDGYNSSGGKNYRIVSAPKKTPTKTYIYKPSTINGVDANGSTRVIVRDANTGALISDTGYLNKAGTGAGSGVSVQDVIQDQRSGSSPLQTAPDWNKVSVGQIKTAGYNTLSEYKSAYNKGLAISPSQIPKTTAPTVTKTTSQKLTEQLSRPPTSPTSTFKLNIDQNKSLIPETVNQDVPTITELGIYNTEKQVTQNLLNSAEYQATLLRLNKLRFNAEKEAGLKTESRATDIYSPEALAQRQLFYGEEKQAGDKKEVDSLNAKVVQFNTNYDIFQQDYKNRDLDKTTPELELTEKNYEDFTRKNKIFQDQKASLDREQSKVESLFRERTTFQDELAKIQNPIIKGYFDPTTPLSAGTTAGITEFQRIETEKQYAGTPAQKAFAGKPKNLITAVLSTPQIYSEQFKQTGTKTTTNPYFDNPNISPQIKNSFTTTTPIYTNIFEGKEITDIKAPRTYEQELEFKKQIGFRAGLAVSRDPYDLQDLTKDLETFRNDVVIGTVAGGVIGTILPTGITTVGGAVTGGLTGAVGGATNVITSNVVERQTGSEFLGESLGTVTGIGAEILSAGAISKAVTKTISANPRLVGSPQSVAYDLGGDKLRVIRYSKFKTGTGFLTRKFDVIDDVIIKRSDLLKNLTKEQTEAIFKQATNAPKYLTDDVIKGRIKVGGGKQTTDITKYMGEFTKGTTKKMPLNELLAKIDVTEYSGVQRISARTGRDLLTKVKTKFKPTVYDDTIEGVSGFSRVTNAEKSILVKKGTKTFQFEGIGFSYSEADELAEGIAKAQKGVKTGVKKITDLKLIGNSKYANLPQKEQVFKLNPKQTSTDLQEDVIFIKAKQQGTRLFTNEADDYSRFIAQTRQKGFSKTITFQGDETLISPVTKFKSDILTFAGSKGKGQIIRTSTKGLPDEYMLRIAGKADDLPKGTQFAKATVTKAGDKVDDVLGLNPVGLKPAKELKLLAEPLSEARKPLLQKELEQAILAYERNATPATLANVQKLSTEMANLRAFTKPTVLTAMQAKMLKAQDDLAKISLDFSKKGSPLTAEQNKAILDFSRKGSPLTAEQNQAIINFSKKGAVFDPETQAKLDAFQKKYGRNLGETRLETFGDTGKTFLSDEAVGKFMADLEKAKPKIKPKTTKITNTTKPTDITDDFFKQLYKPKIKPKTTKITNTTKPTDITDDFFKQLYKPKRKPITKPDDGLLKIKTKGGTQLLQRTKTVKPITDKLTKTATKNITTYKPAVTKGKTKTATMLLEKTKTKTEFLGAKSKTDSKSLTGSKQDYYSRARTAYARARTQTKPLFAQPQARLQTIRNISKLQASQRVLAKSIATTKADTKTKTRTKTDLKTETLTKTDTMQATAIKQATLTDTITLTDTKTDTMTDTATVTKTALITATPTINPFIKIPSFVMPRLKMPNMPNQPQARPDKTKLYTAQVRVKNNSKWKNVSQKPQPYNKAYNEGLEVADNTIGQSVRTVYKKTVKRFIQDDPSIKDYKFRNKTYKSKIPSNPVKIELRQFAIDTFGEKNKLSIEKYLAQKRRRSNKRFINNKGVRLI